MCRYGARFKAYKTQTTAFFCPFSVPATSVDMNDAWSPAIAIESVSMSNVAAVGKECGFSKFDLAPKKIEQLRVSKDECAD